jgi:hypothetical protein
MDTDSFKVEWIDGHREAQFPPNPAYPNGVDLDVAPRPGVPTCHIDLPYPAKRCGLYHVECAICGSNAMITTAGRSDDPRSVRIPCRLEGYG